MICIWSGGPNAVCVSSRTLSWYWLNAQCGCHSVTTIGLFCLMAESSDASMAGELPSTSW
jgi:hypothetical protein